MSNAWLIYNKELLTPISISWEQNCIDSIEIDELLAIDLMTGVENFINYKIIDTNGIITFEKNVKKMDDVPFFWSLLAGNESGFDVSLMVESNLIKLVTNDSINAYLYATIKNDPTWLVRSWRLSSDLIQNGEIIIEMNNALNYSYYLDKIE